MQLSTLKTRALLAGKVSAAIIIFASGVASHDTLKRTQSFYNDLFAGTPATYERALSPHDKAVIAEFTASSTQAQCHQAAEARVYLQEAQAAILQAQHNLAESKRLELLAQPDSTTSNFTNEANFTASLDSQSAATSYKTNKSSTK